MCLRLDCARIGFCFVAQWVFNSCAGPCGRASGKSFACGEECVLRRDGEVRSGLKVVTAGPETGLKFGNGGTQNRDSTSGLKSVTQLRDVGFRFCVQTRSSLFCVPTGTTLRHERSQLG
jgi:hypothetical protein